jgi:hypothetical protein
MLDVLNKESVVELTIFCTWIGNQLRPDFATSLHESPARVITDTVPESLHKIPPGTIAPEFGTVKSEVPRKTFVAKE